MTKLMTVFLATLIMGLPWAAAADKFEGAPIPDKVNLAPAAVIKAFDRIEAERAEKKKQHKAKSQL